MVLRIEVVRLKSRWSLRRYVAFTVNDFGQTSRGYTGFTWDSAYNKCHSKECK